VKIRLLSLVLLSPAFGCAGCAGSDDVSATPHAMPYTCTSTVAAADAADLASKASGSAEGTCVVLNGASYELGAALVVKHGIIVVGGKDVRPVIRGAGIKLEGGKLAYATVEGATGVGVAIGQDGGGMFDVVVTGAKTAGVTIAGGDVRLESVSLEKNAIGMMATGGNVTMTGGRVAENGDTSLTSGLGLVAANGAKLSLDGVTVEKNAATGVLVDGAATTLAMKNAKVLDNGERGVWVQSAEGTLDAPALRLEQTEVARNKIVGVGALESRGIIVVGGRVADTQALPVVTNLATTEPVGDGFGVFSGTGDVKIDGTLVEANARAAGIIDGSDRGIIVVGGKVTAGASGLKVVIQNTTANVDIADDLKSVPTKALGVSATKVKVPSVAPTP
jgi:hypothetical protein